MVRQVSRYQLMARTELAVKDLASLEFDMLISAFDATDRVRMVFSEVRAARKHWLIHHEYRFRDDELPSTGEVYQPGPGDETEFWADYFENSGLRLDALGDTRLCIDVSGFMRPHLMVLLGWAKMAGLSTLDILYSDPLGYVAAERTEFSIGPVTEVRQVRGYEGAHIADSGGNDFMLIGTGYDHELLAKVAESKRAAKKVQLFGLPSLRPHMYQESRLRASRAEESIGPRGNRDVIFAPASNPFVTASVVSSAVSERLAATGESQNVYLAALGTKPQVLGFALYYLLELAGTASSIIHPFARSYNKETAYGISRVWHYRVEFDDPVMLA